MGHHWECNFLMHKPQHKNKPPLSTIKQDKQRINLCSCTTTAQQNCEHFLPEEMAIIPERTSQTSLLAFMHEQM
jgi:hypothetical protein